MGEGRIITMVVCDLGEPAPPKKDLGARPLNSLNLNMVGVVIFTWGRIWGLNVPCGDDLEITVLGVPILQKLNMSLMWDLRQGKPDNHFSYVRSL